MIAKPEVRLLASEEQDRSRTSTLVVSRTLF
jgi:hypothetical protein